MCNNINTISLQYNFKINCSLSKLNLMRKVTLLKLLFILIVISLNLSVTAQVVISQIYGGGGNSGATYKNDFIELYNRGANPVSLNGWSIQYASATGTTWTNSNLPDYTLNSGQYYLVQEAAGTSGTTNLPTPDLIGTLNLSGTAGKVALCNAITSLTANDFNAAKPIGLTIIDFVGFGTTANCYEGSGAAPAPSNTTAVIRNLGAKTDTNENSSDFSTGTPTPRNTVTANHNPSASTFKAYVNGKSLQLSNVANGSAVEIFNALGAKVQSSQLVNGAVALNLSKGLYVVRVAKNTQKFIVK